MSRIVVALMCLATVLFAAGCDAPVRPTPETNVEPIANEEASIGDAMRELVEAAQAGDVEYFMSVEQGADETEADRMMRVVLASNVLEEYESHLTAASPTDARVDFPGMGALVVYLEKDADGWSVTSLLTKR